MVKAGSVTFEFCHADLGYRHKRVLTDINLRITSDSVTCLLGPNGAGKTTLFRSALGFLPPLKGNVRLNGKEIDQYNHRELARFVAYVPQVHNTPFPYKVFDVVLFGRTAHIGYFNKPSSQDKQLALGFMDLLEITHLKDRSFTELSGGERQLVIIARALTQQASFIIFDEPTSNLDYGNQWMVLQKIRILKKQSIGILMATHSPDHAFTIGSNVIILDHGTLFKTGNPEETLTPEILKATYGVDVQVFNTPGDGALVRKVCAPVLV
jgi:iron complex transport system ATP-binding protein